MQFVKQLKNLFALPLLLSGCANMQLHDFKAGVTLPYSEDCFFVNAISGKVTEYPSSECTQIKKRALIILSDDWKIIRQNFQENCQANQCQQLVGQFDQLFLTIDKALTLVPFQGED